MARAVVVDRIEGLVAVRHALDGEGVGRVAVGLDLDTELEWHLGVLRQLVRAQHGTIHKLGGDLAGHAIREEAL